MSSSQMTDIDRVMAERVMGYEIRREGYFIPEDGTLRFFGWWSPSTNIAQAIDCAVKTGLRWALKPSLAVVRDGWVECVSHDNTPAGMANALCRAIINVMEGEDE